MPHHLLAEILVVFVFFVCVGVGEKGFSNYMVDMIKIWTFGEHYKNITRREDVCI